LGLHEVWVTYGHAESDEATLFRGQIATPNVRAQDVDAGRRIPTRVLPKLALTPAPRSTSPVTRVISTQSFFHAPFPIRANHEVHKGTAR